MAKELERKVSQVLSNTKEAQVGTKDMSASLSGKMETMAISQGKLNKPSTSPY